MCDPSQLYAIYTFNVHILSSQMQLKLDPGQTRAWPCSLFNRMSSEKRTHITTTWSSYPPTREDRWDFGWDSTSEKRVSDPALALRKDKEVVDKGTECSWEMPWLVKMNVKNWRKVICNEIWKEQEQLKGRRHHVPIIVPHHSMGYVSFAPLYSSWMGNKWAGSVYSHLCAMVK